MWPPGVLSNQSNTSPPSDYGDDVWERVEAVGTAPVSAANTITAKAERKDALDAATSSIMAELAASFPERER